MDIDHNKQSTTPSSLPMNALTDIPEPGTDAQRIVALVKESGRVVGYKLADERVLGKADAVQLAKQGGISGVGISVRNGNEYLKSLPDGTEDNNLSHLPTIS